MKDTGGMDGGKGGGPDNIRPFQRPDPDRQGYREPPVHPVPAAVWLLAVPMAGIELALSAGASGYVGGARAVGWRLDAMQRFGLSPDMLDRMWQTSQWPADFVMRFVTYAFVHVSFLHAAMVVVFLLALGKFVAEIFGGLAMLALFFGSAIVGAVAYSLIPAAQLGLIGGYPGVYGLIGAFTFILWARLGAANANRYRAFSLIGALLGLQLVFGLIFGAGWDWVAEVTGFATGFLLSFVVGPGGPAHLLRLIRQR
jgi:membrane associated rhomboid family serine protease